MAGPEPLLVAGRYALHDEIASGGMASVHLGRLAGAAGFARVVAIKRLHRQHATNPDIVSMLLDEARLAARIHHPNVAATIDVVEEAGEVLLVFEHIVGESLGSLVRHARNQGERVPIEVVSAIAIGALHGLHAAHEARAPDGTPLAIVHRDVSPQNVLVGADGIARVIDFGIAKANLRSSSTREGELKGKLIYMPPEQLAGHDVTRASDVYAMGVVLWELLAGRRLFDQPTHGGIIAAILAGTIPRLVDEAPWVPAGAAAVVERALAMDPAQRWPTAVAMANALAAALPPADATAVAAFVERIAGEPLARRLALVARVEAAAPAPARGGTGAVIRGSGGARGGLRPIVIALVLVGASLAAGAAFAFAWLGRDTAGDARPARSSTAEETTAPGRDEERELEPPPVEAPEATTPDPEGGVPEGSSSAAPAAAAIAAPPVSTPSPSAGGRRRPPPPRPSATLPSCDPPWEIDDAGIRRVKRHCLGR